MAKITDSSGVKSLNPEEKTKLLNAIRELDNSMTRVAAERDLVKEIVNKTSEETNVNKKIIRRLAKTYHNRSYQIDVQENRDFEEIYDFVTK